MESLGTTIAIFGEEDKKVFLIKHDYFNYCYR